MNIFLFVASLALTLSLARVFRWRSAGPGSTRPYRRAVFAGTAVTALWSVLSGHPWISALVAFAGACAGGVVATSSTMGFVEDNAPVTTGVREKILAYHAFGGLQYRAELRLKRIMDVTAASAVVLLTLPLWVVISLLIWFEEPGPIMFTKNSVGRGGIVFRQVKFRTMQYGAERFTGPIASPAADPRTLRFGAWLRRWHLDEMPELLNVLKGTMSLVGPRPLRAVLVQRYLEDVPGFVHRHSVKPGIACIAQIEKYHISPRERLRKDLVYIRRMCIGLDLRLLWRAVTTTVRGSRSENGEPTAAGRAMTAEE